MINNYCYKNREPVLVQIIYKNVIKLNFDIERTYKYGNKHFFGFNNLKNSDNTIFICIVRNLTDWINSLFREKHHLHLKYKKNLKYEEQLDEFLNKNFGVLTIVMEIVIYQKK